MAVESQDWYRPADSHSVAGQGRPLPLTVVPSPCHAPLPPHPATLQMCSKGCQELEGTLPWMTLLPSFYTLLCPSYLQLSPPSTSKTWLKPVTELIHWICCSFPIHGKINCRPSSFTHEKNVIWKSFYIHLSLLMANPNARPQANFHVASHWCSNSTLIYNHQSLGERESGEGSQFSFLFTWCGFKGPWNSVLLQQDLEVRVWLVSSLPWSRCLFSSSVSEAFLHLP